MIIPIIILIIIIIIVIFVVKYINKSATTTQSNDISTIPSPTPPTLTPTPTSASLTPPVPLQPPQAPVTPPSPSLVPPVPTPDVIPVPIAPKPVPVAPKPVPTPNVIPVPQVGNKSIVGYNSSGPINQWLVYSTDECPGTILKNSCVLSDINMAAAACNSNSTCNVIWERVATDWLNRDGKIYYQLGTDTSNAPLNGPTAAMYVKQTYSVTRPKYV